MERVAVIIVSYNSASLVQHVLEALGRQTVRPDEIYVIDNASDDREELMQAVAEFPHCNLILLECNIGFAAANNLGIAKVEGVEFVALLNPDAFPEPDWLSELLTVARCNRSCASFSSRLLDYSNPDHLDGAGDSLSIAGRPKRRGHGLPAENRYLSVEPVFCASAAAALYRRAAVLEVGGFDEDFFCYLEDVDLGFRLRLAGYESFYVPSAVARHVGSATTGGQSSDFSVYHGHRNLVWTFVKDVPGPMFWLLLPLHIVLNITSLLMFVVQGRGGVLWRAKRDAVVGLPKAWRKRRIIQARRRASMRDVWAQLGKSIFTA